MIRLKINQKSLFISLLFFFNYALGDLKNVYVYINIKPEYYYEEHHEFLRCLFGDEYQVMLTPTLDKLSNVDYIVTVEVPHNNVELRNLGQYPPEKVIFFSFETQISNPRSHNKYYHHYYSKAFTWNDDLIDNIKYFKVRFPWMDPRPMVKDRPTFENKKLSIFVGEPRQRVGYYANYVARTELVQFFEVQPGSDFDLYGLGWEQSNYKNFKGLIPLIGNRRENKINVLKNYKFDFCYENTINVNGWLSERIFEDFAAGCVPVYWGCNNVEDYIPRGCFIPRQDFKNNEELYSFLQNVKKDEYETYIKNIEQFLTTENAYRLSTRYYIEKIRTVLGINVNNDAISLAQ
jgi:hypothetical protein